MVKVIVQIPCFNEAETLPQVIADIPQKIDGVDAIEVLVIDDGSTDGTHEVAKAAGAHHVVRNKTNLGLAQSFQAGLEAALAAGADVIVNTDGDNQYNGADISRLVEPVLAGRADIVVGDRQTGDIAHFSPLKKRLQRLGSGVVKRLSGVDIPDAVSGFRAFSRAAAMTVTVRSSFSYTTETLIQAGKKRLTVQSVPIKTNGETRPSRLFRSIPHFIVQSAKTMLRAYAMYEPLKVFLGVGVFLMLVGAAPIARFVMHFLAGDGQGMVQSLILGGVLFLMGTIAVMFAVLADLVAYNRQLLELTLERVRKLEYDDRKAPATRQRFAESAVRDAVAELKHMRLR